MEDHGKPMLPEGTSLTMMVSFIDLEDNTRLRFDDPMIFVAIEDKENRILKIDDALLGIKVTASSVEMLSVLVHHELRRLWKYVVNAPNGFISGYQLRIRKQFLRHVGNNRPEGVKHHANH